MSGVKKISKVKIAVIFDGFEKRRVQCSQGPTQTQTAQSSLMSCKHHMV